MEEKNCKCLQGKGTEIYEDDDAVIIIPEEPATEGHIQVIAKKHSNELTELKTETVQHLFHLANYAAATLFETTQAQGTNIMMNEGKIFEGHICVNVLSRKMDDGLNFLWQPKQLQTNEMDEVAEKIRDNMNMGGKATEKKKETQQEKIIKIEKQLENVRDEVIDTPEKENYLIKQLERIP